MSELNSLLEANQHWAETIKESDPEFFAKLSEKQLPDYLWIGCSDSRVPANEIVGLLPGEMFVHRNVANLVVAHGPELPVGDAVRGGVLKVRHIIVCGHYGCGGVQAALRDEQLGPDRQLAASRPGRAHDTSTSSTQSHDAGAASTGCAS